MSKGFKITIVLMFVLTLVGIVFLFTQDTKLYSYVYKKEVCKLIGREIVPCWPESNCPVSLPCHTPYRDAGRACQSDNECIGGCNLRYPKIENINNSKSYPREILINNIKCEVKEDNLSFTTYICPGIKFKGKCASFPFEEVNAINLKDEKEIIFNHPVFAL